MPTVSADGMTYTFTLRDAKYSNGDPIVAGDIVYAWQRLIDPRLATYYQQFLEPVKGAADILKLTGTKASDATIDAALDKLGVSAPDDKTFVLSWPTRAPTSSTSSLCGAPRPCRRSGSPARTHRGCQLRQLRPVHDEELDPPG